MLADHFSRIVPVDYQPTCENMLVDFAERLLEALPDEVQLYSLRLHETASQQRCGLPPHGRKDTPRSAGHQG